MKSMLTALCASLLVGMSTPALAQDAPSPMALRGVMQQLGTDMQATTLAIALEDWNKVAELAPHIGDHAEPPALEKVRILTWLGTQAPTFRGFDRQVHADAQAMGEAAKQKNGKLVIQKFADIQQGCLACHQTYRKDFITRFYGQSGH